MSANSFATYIDIVIPFALAIGFMFIKTKNPEEASKKNLAIAAMLLMGIFLLIKKFL